MSSNKNNSKPAPIKNIRSTRTKKLSCAIGIQAQTKSNTNFLSVVEKTPVSSTTPTINKKTSHKKPGSSTPVDNSKNSGLTSFFDLSRLPDIQTEVKPKSGLDGNMLYNEYLRSSLIENLLDETTSKNVIDVDVQISALRKRLEYNRLLLEETDKKLKAVTQLSEQQSLLNKQQDYLKASLDRENTLKSIPQLSILREKLKFSANRVSTRNIMLEDNVVSVNQVNKLNEAISHLQNGLKEIDNNGGGFITGMRGTVQNLNDAIQVNETLGQSSLHADDGEEKLGTLMLQDTTVKLLVDKLLSTI